MNATWAETKVLESIGIPSKEASSELIGLASVALERCYYIDRAADWLWDYLKGPRG